MNDVQIVLHTLTRPKEFVNAATFLVTGILPIEADLILME